MSIRRSTEIEILTCSNVMWRIIAKDCSLCGNYWSLCNGALNGSTKSPSLLTQNCLNATRNCQHSCNSTYINCEPPYLYCNSSVAKTSLTSAYREKLKLNTKRGGVPSCNHYNEKLTNFVKSNVHLCLYSVLNEPSNSSSPLPSASDCDNLPSPAQLSFLLLKLRDELPQFFSDHHSYQTLYHRDVQFVNKLMGVAFSVRGRSNYRICLSSLRHAICAINSNVNLELIKITKDVETGKIEARWRITGTPRYYLPWIVTRVLIEGFSTFTVDKSGKITLHVMDKVMPVPKHKIWVQSFLIRLRGLIPKPFALQTHTSERLS